VLEAVALGDQLLGIDIEVGNQELAHRLGPPLRQLEIVVGAALGVGVPGDQERILGQAARRQRTAERVEARRRPWA
jgi:hypothetical protein